MRRSVHEPIDLEHVRSSSIKNVVFQKQRDLSAKGERGTPRRDADWALEALEDAAEVARCRKYSNWVLYGMSSFGEEERLWRVYISLWGAILAHKIAALAGHDNQDALTLWDAPVTRRYEYLPGNPDV